MLMARRTRLVRCRAGMHHLESTRRTFRRWRWRERGPSTQVASTDGAFAIVDSGGELRFDFGPTDPVMPAEESTDDSAGTALAQDDTQDVHAELEGEYFDPSA
jgi:hypothetical protein